MNLVGIDKDELHFVELLLRGKGYDEVANILAHQAVPIEYALQEAAKECPALYMKFVTEQMMINYT